MCATASLPTASFLWAYTSAGTICPLAANLLSSIVQSAKGRGFCCLFFFPFCQFGPLDCSQESVSVCWQTLQSTCPRWHEWHMLKVCAYACAPKMLIDDWLAAASIQRALTLAPNSPDNFVSSQDASSSFLADNLPSLICLPHADYHWAPFHHSNSLIMTISLSAISIFIPLTDRHLLSLSSGSDNRPLFIPSTEFRDYSFICL